MTKDEANDELTIAYMSGLHRGKELAQRTWVGLTDEEIASVEYNNHPLDGIRSFARAIEAKLKEKNHD